MSRREWITVGLVAASLIVFVAVALASNQSQAASASELGHEFHVSIADICPN